MAQPSKQLISPPTLTPQFCFSTSIFRDFLRASRASVDDTITQSLNALVVPSEAGFDPNSTSQRRPDLGSHQIKPSACQSFQDRVLFPTWRARTEVLDYCSFVATSPDPDDPDMVLRQAEILRDSKRVVDERLDPYSGRFFPREARTESLALLLRQERSIEDIVRSRTWDTVQRRCGAPHESWENALKRWNEKRVSDRNNPKQEYVSA